MADVSRLMDEAEIWLRPEALGWSFDSGLAGLGRLWGAGKGSRQGSRRVLGWVLEGL